MRPTYEKDLYTVNKWTSTSGIRHVNPEKKNKKNEDRNQRWETLFALLRLSSCIYFHPVCFGPSLPLMLNENVLSFMRYCSQRASGVGLENGVCYMRSLSQSLMAATFSTTCLYSIQRYFSTERISSVRVLTCMLTQMSVCLLQER